MAETERRFDRYRDAPNAIPAERLRPRGTTVRGPDGLLELGLPCIFGLDERRYEIGELLGQGGNGKVYAAYDRDLDREVAIKVIHIPDAERRERCVREARVMASLGHPNVPPLYDVGSAGSAVYLTMPRITGRSLGGLIRQAQNEHRNEALPAATLVEVLVKVCDAVSYAHARGIVHQDIKPDNVMIGDYGEVKLLDWGAASRPAEALSGRTRIFGTPAYMAPEQARGDAACPSWDVYALGGTLFHALLLRPPLAEPDRDRFWRRKLFAEIDLPSQEELARVPRAILSVALKAMSADPNERYPNPQALAQALREYQSGRGVWAAPLVSEAFLDDGFRERWVSPGEGDFVREPGRLVSASQLGGLLIYKKRLAAGIAVEFDGEILPDAQPGDLSVVWSEDNLLEGGAHWPRHGTTWSLQVGAFANLLAGIYRDFSKCVSGRSLSIAVGRRYRVRAEINEQNLRLFLDGELIAEYEDLFPIPSGYVALYSYYPGKAFYNLRVYERGVPERLSPTAIGDAFFADQDYAGAATQYARVEQLAPSSEVAEEARYKRGLSLLRAGDAGSADQAWRGLRDEEWRARAALHAVDADFVAGRHEQVVSELRRLLQQAPALRDSIINRWSEYVGRLCQSNALALDVYAGLRESEFPSHVESASAAASLELACGRWAEVTERFFEQHLQYVQACNLLGKFERVVERYADAPWIRDMALLRLNRYDAPELTEPFRNLGRLLRDGVGVSRGLPECAEALLVSGCFERVIERDFVEPEDLAAALRGIGRSDEAVLQGDARALIEAHAGEEALSRGLRLSERLYFLHHLALQALFSGDRAGYLRHRQAGRDLPCGAIWADVWVHRYLLLPLGDELCGDRHAFVRGLREAVSERRSHWYEKLCYMARFVLGEIDEHEFLRQPCGLYVEARLLFARALRAELLRERNEAVESYQAYLRLPPIERAIDSARGDPLVERWAKFRSG